MSEPAPTMLPAEPAPASVPASTATPVAANERITTLDLVRGLAVLGILVMNVVEFALPMSAYENPIHAGGSTGIDRWVWYVQMALFDGKMRALFSMLFGAGLVLITERMERAGRGAESGDLLVRRCLWLALFGVLHRFGLQWTGDILYTYGLLALIAIAFRQWRPRSLLVAGVLCLGAFTPIGLWHHHQVSQQRAQAEQAVALETAGQPVSQALKDAKTRWDRRLAAPKPDANDAEIAAIRGGYASVFAYRWDHHHSFQSGFVYYYFVWDVLGMVFTGMALCRWGFFAGRLRRGVYLAIIAAGAVAAGSEFWHAWLVAQRGFSSAAIDLRLWHDVLHPFARGLVGLAWASALILVHRSLAQRGGVVAFALARLAAVGRMAFTNYVLQTVCCTLLFFGYGLGLYGTLSRSQLMLVWLGVSVVQVLLSWLWLAWFRFGPLEWLWRSLTWWKVQPLRRERIPTAP